MTPNFTLAEFTRSTTAARRGFDNALPPHLIPAAQRTLELLECIRAHLTAKARREVPITILSGYRSEAVNRAVGSSDTSDHRRAMAADIAAPAFGTPTEVALELARVADVMGIGQLINEFPGPNGWVHVSTRRPDKAINRIITITSAGTVVGIKGA